jgi:hypothetical protein
MTAVGHQAAPTPEPEPPGRAADSSQATAEGPAALGGGFALPPGVGHRMSVTVGGDLSRVRLHTDPAAAALAARSGALAVAEGQHVAFAAGWYRPGTLAGEAVLAHELAHTRQQAAAAGGERARAPAWPGLETEADRAGYAAVMRLLDPGWAPAGPVPTTAAGGLRLQRCVMPGSEQRIQPLPDREYYERRGRLPRRGMEDFTGTAGAIDLQGIGGDLVLEMPGATVPAPAPPTEAAGLGRTPLPADLGDGSPVLSPQQQLTRLAAMEATQKRIDATVQDLTWARSGYLISSPAGGVLHAAQLRLQMGDDLPFVLVMPGAQSLPPLDLAEESRQIVRSEAVQARCLDGLVELKARREQEEATGQRLASYDPGPALAEIDRVRRLYVGAVDAILTPDAVRLVTAAETEHTVVEQTLLKMQLEYFERKKARYPEVAPALEEIHDWAASLRSRLTALEKAAPELTEARRTSAPDVEERERRFTRDAALLAVGIEALGEWDVAVQAYEYLRGNSALWGFEGADDIGHRLWQMRKAYDDDDLAYLQVLLEDHRADPDLARYLESLPSIVEWSQFAIMMAITLIAVVASAGVGMIVGAGVTSGLIALGAAKGSMLVVGTTFVLKVGAEALVFTLIARSLAAQFPGMAPTSPFWSEFLWNFGLFFSMKLLTGGAQGLMKLASASKLATRLAVGATAYATLQAYGYLRFYIETGDTMNLRQFVKMSVQNAIMLVGLTYGAKAFEPLLGKLEGLIAASRFRSLYGERFARINAERADLVRDTQQRVTENPQATPEDAADLQSRAQDIDTRLQALVEEVAGDPRVDTRALQRETGQLVAEVEAVSLPELFRQAGLDPAVDLRSSGSETAWSYETGKTDALVRFLTEQGHEVGSVTTLSNEAKAVDAIVPGKGRMFFVERVKMRPRPPEAPPATGRAAARRRAAVEARAARSGRTVEQETQLLDIQNLRERVHRWRREAVGDPETVAATRVYLDNLNALATRARRPGQVAGEIEADIADMRQVLESMRPRRAPSDLDTIQRVEQRLRRRAARTRRPETRATFEQLADRAAQLRALKQADPNYDSARSLRQIRAEERTAGVQEYEVYVPLDDPAVFAEIEAWLAGESRPLLDYPGGEMLRNEMLDQLHGADVMVLRQSPRQAGRDVATTEQMRRQVEEGITQGRYPPEYVEAFEANRGPDGWPRTSSGRPWEVDHVRELWQGGEDNASNYLPIHPRLHAIKTALMGRFRARYRERSRRAGRQTDVRETE